MDRQPQDKVQRLRAVLRKMEQSIDNARLRRESTGQGDFQAGQVEQSHRSSTTPDLDTPILGQGHVSNSHPAPPPRTEESMFNFDQPRLKARAKRRPAV
ncbi:MAG: hypothetical protein MK085_00085 [Phycisphaerales bacterium]|nr:hypothetical protein [Phycisphaerales bacterium]